MVRDQQIASASQDEKRNLPRSSEIDSLDDLIAGSRFRKPASGATDLEARPRRQGDVFEELQQLRHPALRW